MTVLWSALPSSALLSAFGLPRALVCGYTPPRVDTFAASWSIFAIDPVGDCYYSRAALLLLLRQCETSGWLADLDIDDEELTAAHVLVSARWRVTGKGQRRVVKVMSESDGN